MVVNGLAEFNNVYQGLEQAQDARQMGVERCTDRNPNSGP